MAQCIAVFKITLADVRPPVWRRLELPGGWNLEQLHQGIQAAFGWGDCHMHQFEIKGRFFAPPDPDNLGGSQDSRQVTLANLEGKVSRFSYTYDFGDDWRHAIHIEAWKDAEPGVRYPRCIGGKRACPPEDCGGPWGYEELMGILRAPKHKERAERLEWLGGEFDPAEFELEEADAAVAAVGGERKRGWHKAK